jgi:glutathione S-transferase
MKLLLNTTSPYARIARIALEEKDLDVATEVVDPWADDPRLLEANTAARVPALLTDDGRRPDLGAIAAVVALDYVRFRFAQATWMPAVLRLDRLAAQLAPRASFERSRPRA